MILYCAQFFLCVLLLANEMQRARSSWPLVPKLSKEPHCHLPTLRNSFPNSVLLTNGDVWNTENEQKRVSLMEIVS